MKTDEIWDLARLCFYLLICFLRVSPGRSQLHFLQRFVRQQGCNRSVHQNKRCNWWWITRNVLFFVHDSPSTRGCLKILFTLSLIWLPASFLDLWLSTGSDNTRRPNKTHRYLKYNFIFVRILNVVTFLSCVLTFVYIIGTQLMKIHDKGLVVFKLFHVEKHMKHIRAIKLTYSSKGFRWAFDQPYINLTFWPKESWLIQRINNPFLLLYIFLICSSSSLLNIHLLCSTVTTEYIHWGWSLSLWFLSASIFDDFFSLKSHFHMMERWICGGFRTSCYVSQWVEGKILLSEFDEPIFSTLVSIFFATHHCCCAKPKRRPLTDHDWCSCHTQNQ